MEHIFSPSSNPRNAGVCVKCGKDLEHGEHAEGITVPEAILRMHRAMENPLFRNGLKGAHATRT